MSFKFFLLERVFTAVVAPGPLFSLDRQLASSGTRLGCSQHWQGCRLPGHPDSSFHGCHGSSSMPGFSSPRGLQPLSDMLSSSDPAALCCPAQRKGERGELGTSAEADGQGCWAGTHPKWQVWDRHGLTGQMLSASGKLKRD